MALTDQTCMETSKPVCDYCDHEVPEGFWYVINGDVICKGCLDDNFKVKASDDEGDEE